MFEEGDGPPTGKPVNVRVQAPTNAAAISASTLLLSYMRQDDNLVDLVDLGDNRPVRYRTVKFEPRQEAVYQYNLSAAQITAIVAGVLNGRPAGPFRAADEEVDLIVRMARADDLIGDAAGLKTPLDILAVPVIEDSASPIYLRDLVTARFVEEPNVRSRYQGKPTITISADIKPGSNLSAAVVQKRVQDPFQYHLEPSSRRLHLLRRRVRVDHKILHLPGHRFQHCSDGHLHGAGLTIQGLSSAVDDPHRRPLCHHRRGLWYFLHPTPPPPPFYRGQLYRHHRPVGCGREQYHFTHRFHEQAHSRRPGSAPGDPRIVRRAHAAGSDHNGHHTAGSSSHGHRHSFQIALVGAYGHRLCHRTLQCHHSGPVDYAANYELLGQLRSRIRRRKFKLLRKRNGRKVSLAKEK